MFQIQKGQFNKADLKEAYELYFDSLRGFLYYKTRNMELSEDLVQEVFIKVWEKRDVLKKETLKSLLYTMANNLVINHFNHQKVVNTHQEGEMRMGAVEKETPQYVIEEQEFKERFDRIINSIPEGSREVFLMNRIEKLKYDEIAERLDLSVKAVEKRMSKALQIMKHELGRKV